MTCSLSGLITTDLLDLYTAGEDAMWVGLGKNCDLIYSPQKTQCPNCLYDPGAKRSSNVYKSGGPISFTSGLCPYCNGAGMLETVNTETISLQVGWEPKGFLDIFKPIVLQNTNIQSPKTFIQIKGRLVDLPKVRQCVEILILKDLSSYIKYRCKKVSEATPSGIRQNKYFYMLLERAT